MNISHSWRQTDLMTLFRLFSCFQQTLVCRKSGVDSNLFVCRVQWQGAFYVSLYYYKVFKVSQKEIGRVWLKWTMKKWTNKQMNNNKLFIKFLSNEANFSNFLQRSKKWKGKGEKRVIMFSASDNSIVSDTEKTKQNKILLLFAVLNESFVVNWKLNLKTRRLWLILRNSLTFFSFFLFSLILCLQTRKKSGRLNSLVPRNRIFLKQNLKKQFLLNSSSELSKQRAFSLKNDRFFYQSSKQACDVTKTKGS